MRLDRTIRGLKRLALAESFLSAWACQIGLLAGMLPWVILLSAFVLALKSSEDLGGGYLVFGVAFGLVLGCAVTAPLVWILGVAAKYIQAYADAWRDLTFPSGVKTHFGKLLAVIIAALPGFPVLLSFGVIGCVARVLGEKALRRVQIGSDAKTPPIPLLDFLRTHPLREITLSKERRKAYVRATVVLFLEIGGILAVIWIVAELIVFAVTPSSEVPEVNVWARYFIPYLIALVVQCRLSLRLVDDMQKNRALLVTSLDDVEIRDRRHPILLLRSFEDEHHLTSSNSMRFLNTTRSSVKSLEERITERLWRFGPVFALGHPGDASPPIGAARRYVAAAPDAMWQNEIARLSGKCCAIVLVVGCTRGILWEMEHIRRESLLDRLLLVIPPKMTEADWAEFCTRAGVEQLTPCHQLGSGAARLLGFSFLHRRATSYTGTADRFGYEAVSLVGVAEIISGNTSNSGRSGTTVLS